MGCFLCETKKIQSFISIYKHNVGKVDKISFWKITTVYLVGVTVFLDLQRHQHNLGHGNQLGWGISFIVESTLLCNKHGYGINLSKFITFYTNLFASGHGFRLHSKSANP